MSSSDIAISVRGVSKAYTISHKAQSRPTFREMVMERIRHPNQKSAHETFWALKDISFDVMKGEVVGIIGRNGAGKSTLLKILSRITEPTAGRIDLYGRVGSLLEVGTGFHPELTGRENVYLNGQILGMRKKEIDRQFDAIVDFAGVEQFLDTPVKRYSSGMYVRLAFAVAAHLEPEVLIVDEVLAVGDAEFQRRCLGKMGDVAKSGRTVLFVSHNMAAVDSLCSTAILLANGQVAASGDLRKTVTEYMGKGIRNHLALDDGPLRSVSIQQCGKALRIDAVYSHHTPLALPSLGFVINDLNGVPICGSNPMISGILPVAAPRKSGTVTAHLTHPRLLDGTYRLSVWFGDGTEDFFSQRDCITFDVVGMAGPKQLSAAVVGPVFPECEWELVPPNTSPVVT